MASLAVAAITSLVDTETVAVKFDTFGFFTVAEYFFAGRIGFGGDELFEEFFMVTDSFMKVALPDGSGMELFLDKDWGGFLGVFFGFERLFVDLLFDFIIFRGHFAAFGIF